MSRLIRPPKSESNGRSTSYAGSPHLMEPLERRILLSSTIEWVNRGTLDNDSDNFVEYFGVLAGTARGVVDAVIEQWEQTILDFNWADGTTSFKMNLFVETETGGDVNWDQTRGQANPTKHDGTGRPTEGRVRVGRGIDPENPNTSLWWFDPTPHEHSEFTGTIGNVFWGRRQDGSPAAGKVDFYSLVAHEMGHMLGMTSWSGYRWGNNTATVTFTDTEVDDTQYLVKDEDTEEEKPVGTWWTFNGPSIDHLLTNVDGSGAGAIPAHTAGNQAVVTFDGVEYYGAGDLMNPRIVSGRALIPDTTAMMLADVYGYTISLPQRRGTFHAMLLDDGEVLVRGAPGNVADTFTVSTFGNDIVIGVDLENDVPGTGSKPGAGNLPAFVSMFPASDVNRITINTGSGDDTVHIQSLHPGMGVTVNAGSEGTNDIIVSFENVHSLVTINGNGNDKLLVSDIVNPGSYTYNISSSTILRDGFAGMVYNGVANLSVMTADGGNIIRINGTHMNTRTFVSGGSGNDEVYVGNGNVAGNIGGELIVTGHTGTDSISLDDTASTGNRNYSLDVSTTYRFNMTGLADEIAFGQFQSVVLLANDHHNVINVVRTLAGTQVAIDGRGGDDTINVGNGQLRTHIRGDLVVWGGPGNDTLRLLDRFETLNQDADYRFDLNTFSRTLTPSIIFTGIQETVLETSDFDNTITVESTVPTAAVTVFAGEGVNHLRLQPPAMNLDSIPAMVTMHGILNNDRISLVDSFAAGNQSWTITNELITRPGFGGLRYLGFLDRISLQAGNGDDTFDILSTSGTLAEGLFLFGADGRDSFIVHQPPLTPLRINGDQPFSTPGDSLTVYGAGLAGLYRPSENIPGFGTVIANGVPIFFTGIEDWVSVENFASFNLITPNSEDVIDIHAIPAQQRNIISGSSGGVAFTPLRFRDVAAFVLDTATNDDPGPGVSSNDLVTIHDPGLLAANLARFVYMGGIGLDRLIVNGGTYHFDHDALAFTENLTIEVNTDGLGTAEVVFDHTQHLAGLIVGRDGFVEITHTGSEPSKVVVTQLLTISGGSEPAGRIDVMDNDMIIARALGDQPTTFLNVWHWVRAGYNNGAWNGMGIMSSTAATNRLRDTAVGLGPNEDLGYTEFSGEPVTPNDILVKYTWYGDANLDGMVNIADLSLVAANWQESPRHWHKGDFNFDLLVNIADLSLLAANWQKGVGSPLFADSPPIEEDEEDEELEATPAILRGRASTRPGAVATSAADRR